MNLIQKTSTTEHLLKLEKISAKTNQLVNAAIMSLNDGYKYLWSLPDDQLQSVLQALLDNGKLVELFETHYFAATSLNGIQDASGVSGNRAIAVAGREFTVDNGTVTVIPLPEQEETPPPFEGEVDTLPVE